MGFVINFDDQEVSEGFEIVKEGKYECTITSAELEFYQGNPNINFAVEIRSDVPQEHQGQKILYNTIYMVGTGEFAESTNKKRNAFLVACGYTGQKALDLEKVEKEILNKQVLATVKHKKDKKDPSKVFPKVTFVAPSKVAKTQKMEVDGDDLPF